MVFRKPYAFLIKYFRLINLILTILVGGLIYKLSNLYDVINQLYLGNISNYSNLSNEYIGFMMYLLIFGILLILLTIIILLKNKKKPLKDYLFLVIYEIIIVIFLFVVDNNLFYVLMDNIVEQSTIKLYSDIALLVILPLFYFFIKYLLIVIGFNLNKFNFTKDIIELKAEAGDNEEIELIFDKNTYKYKRNIRRSIREFKYYVLENKLFVIIICSVLLLIGLSTFVGIKIFDNNNVRLNENFVSNSISYNVQSLYETKYDMNNNIIKDTSKFVIAKVKVKNTSMENKSIKFDNIRLFYGDEYVYANNYFNKFFTDIGIPYNNQLLKSGESYDYIFIFQVPQSYKSNKYKIKFYNGIKIVENESVGDYKILSVKANILDEKLSQKTFMLGENVVFDEKKYGKSNVTFRSYNIQNNYVSEFSDGYEVINPDNINHVLLILDYELMIDENSELSNVINNSYDFYNKFLKIEYKYNGVNKRINNISLKKSNINGKVFVSIPSEIKNAEEIKVILCFRNMEIIYKIK